MLEKLLQKLLENILENVGAEKGVLLLNDLEDWWVRARGSINNHSIF